MRHILDISADTTEFPWDKRTPFDAVPALLAISLCLGVGYWTGHESAGAIAAGAAFTAGFAIFHEAMANTLLSMFLVTLGIASGALLGSLGASWSWAVLLLALVAAVNYGLLSAISPTAGWIAMQSAVFVIVASYFKQGLKYAVGRAEMVLLGGSILMLFHVLVYWVRPHPDHVAVPVRPVRLRARLRGLWVRVQAHSRLNAETAPYTLRMAFTLVLCTALYRHYHVRNGYWSPMTALLVLKPQWSATLSRGIARLAGTLVGAGIALLLARTATFNTVEIYLLILVCAWGCYTLQAVNYAVFSMFITLYIVFLFRFGGFSQTSAAHIRLLNTAVGGGLALGIDWVWLRLAGLRKAAPRTSERPLPDANFVQ